MLLKNQIKTAKNRNYLQFSIESEKHSELSFNVMSVSKKDCTAVSEELYEKFPDIARFFVPKKGWEKGQVDIVLTYHYAATPERINEFSEHVYADSRIDASYEG